MYVRNMTDIIHVRSARDSCKFNRDNFYNSVGDKKRLKDFVEQYSQSDL